MTLLTLSLVLAQAPPAPIDWSRTFALVGSIGGALAVLWLLLGPLVDRLATWRTRAPESGMAGAIRDALTGNDQQVAKTAAMIRDSLATDEQAPHTATWILDMLRERPEETRGFIASHLRDELLSVRTLEQTAREMRTRADDHAESLRLVRATLTQHGDTLNILPALQQTFQRFERAMEKMQGAMEDMSARMARMEGAAGWDGRDRREHGR